MSRLPPRLALAFDTYGLPVIVFVLALGIVGAGVGAAEFASAERTTVTDHTDTQTVSTNLSSTATVTENSTLFAPGTELVDRSYPIASAPNVTVVVHTGTSTSTPLEYDHELALRYRITRGDEVVWSDTESLGAENGTREDGARTAATFSMRDVRDRLAELSTAAGSRSSVTVTLVVESAYQTERYQGEFTRTAELDIGDRWYGVQSVAADRQHSTPEQRQVSVDAANADAWAFSIGGGALLVLGLVGTVAKRRFDVDDEAALRHRVHESRYDDWISHGHVPESFDRRVVTMASLADLAELAIDRRRRLVFDQSRQVYAVFDADVVYYYDEFWTDHEPPEDGD